MVFDNVTGELYVANAGFGNNGANTPDDYVVNVSSLTVVSQFSVGEYQAGLTNSFRRVFYSRHLSTMILSRH